MVSEQTLQRETHEATERHGHSTTLLPNGGGRIVRLGSNAISTTASATVKHERAAHRKPFKSFQFEYNAAERALVRQQQQLGAEYARHTKLIRIKRYK